MFFLYAFLFCLYIGVVAGVTEKAVIRFKENGDPISRKATVVLFLFLIPALPILFPISITWNLFSPKKK